MTAVNYLPAAVVAENLQTFVQFASPQGTTILLAAALNTAFGAMAGNVQCFADATTGQTTNAVVDVNNNVVFSVPVNNYVTFFNGVWAQYTPDQMTAKFVQYFTS